jgi:ubiquinone/menaquinone biosynthesis C-methylase UbiE
MAESSLTAKKYRELFRLRAEGKLDDMECTKRLFELLRPLYFKGIKILDVPCGVGHYFRKLRELGEIEYLGVDLDSEAIRLAKEVWKDAPNAKFEVQDASRMNIPNNSIDVAICYNLLLHLKDYKDVLRELFRVSKRYIIVRSLFDAQASVNKIPVSEDYLEVYKEGVLFYNTYSRDDVVKFVRSLGRCKVRFINDNLAIPKEVLEKQQKALGVASSEFASGDKNQKQDWKGLALNYEVLVIEKAND